jgi:hypothetical protein
MNEETDLTNEGDIKNPGGGRDTDFTNAFTGRGIIYGRLHMGTTT